MIPCKRRLVNYKHRNPFPYAMKSVTNLKISLQQERWFPSNPPFNCEACFPIFSAPSADFFCFWKYLHTCKYHFKWFHVQSSIILVKNILLCMFIGMCLKVTSDSIGVSLQWWIFVLSEAYFVLSIQNMLLLKIVKYHEKYCMLESYKEIIWTSDCFEITAYWIAKYYIVHYTHKTVNLFHNLRPRSYAHVFYIDM